MARYGEAGWREAEVPPGMYDGWDHESPRGYKTVAIYYLVDPRSGEERYVGQTEQPPAIRLEQHIQEARAGRGNLRKALWIRDLLDRGLRPEIEAPLWVEPWRADKVEMNVIADCLYFGSDLLNLHGHDGGAGLESQRGCAQHSFTVDVSDDLLKEIRQQARESGVSLRVYATLMLSKAVQHDLWPEVIEDSRRKGGAKE